MKPLKFLMFMTPFFIMAGCDDYYMIGSLNPFYLEENIVLLPEIEGEWNAKPYKSNDGQNVSNVWKMADSTLTWRVHRKLDGSKKPTNFYQVKLTGNRSDSLNYVFDVVIFRLDEDYYADFCPVSNLATDNSRLAFENNYPIHTLSRILISNNQFTFSWLEDETMKTMIEEKRVRASFRWINSTGKFVLTGSSKQLTRMIEQYCNQERFVEWDKQAAMITLSSAQ